MLKSPSGPLKSSTYPWISRVRVYREGVSGWKSRTAGKTERRRNIVSRGLPWTLRYGEEGAGVGERGYVSSWNSR